MYKTFNREWVLHRNTTIFINTSNANINGGKKYHNVQTELMNKISAVVSKSFVLYGRKNRVNIFVIFFKTFEVFGILKVPQKFEFFKHFLTSCQIVLAINIFIENQNQNGLQLKRYLLVQTGLSNYNKNVPLSTFIRITLKTDKILIDKFSILKISLHTWNEKYH